MKKKQRLLSYTLVVALVMSVAFIAPLVVSADQNSQSKLYPSASATIGAGRSSDDMAERSSDGTAPLTAFASAKKVKATFNANGGKIGSKSKTVKKITKGKKLGKLPVAKRTGYKLKGWYTKKSSGKKITKSTKIKKNTTYYARWTKKGTATPTSAAIHTVTFDTTGGSAVASRKVKHGAVLGTLPSAPTRSGYTFSGWFSAKTGGIKITASTIVNANITYYARWTNQTTSVIPATGISLNRNNVVFTISANFNMTELNAVVTPANASDKTVTWTSSNTNLATVSQDGTVRVNKVLGTAVITAKTHNGITATCTITMADWESVDVYLPATKIEVGQTMRAVAKTKPTAGLEYMLVWRCNNSGGSTTGTTVASISEDGLITALSAGTAYVHSRANFTPDIYGGANFEVVPKPTSISLSSTSKTIGIGENYQIPAPILSPTNALPGYNYTSSNVAVAKVSADGRVTAVAQGSATITVKHVTSGKTATLAVTVSPPSTGQPIVGFNRVEYFSGSGTSTKVKLVINVTIPSTLNCATYDIGIYSTAAQAQAMQSGNAINGNWGNLPKTETAPSADDLPPGLVYVGVQAKNTSGAKVGNATVVKMAALHHPRNLYMCGMWHTYDFGAGGIIVPYALGYWLMGEYTPVPGAAGVLETLEKVTPYANGTIFKPDGSYQSAGIIARSYGSKTYNGKVRIGYNTSTRAGDFVTDTGFNPPPSIYIMDFDSNFVVTLRPYVDDPDSSNPDDVIFGEPYIAHFSSPDFMSTVFSGFEKLFPNVY